MAERLGSPWVIGAIGLLVVVGVGIGLVFGVDAALDDQRRAERTTRIVDLTEDVIDVVSALQDERGRAARFLVDRSDSSLRAYLDSFDGTDRAADVLVATWSDRVIEGLERDIEALVSPIEELPAVRESILDQEGDESSPVELYSGLLAPLTAELSILHAREGLGRLETGNAMLELIAAAESAGVRRAVGTRVVGGGAPVPREDDVLIRVETRRLLARLAAARSVPGEGEVVAAMVDSDPFRRVDAMVAEMLETTAEGGFSFTEPEWFGATTAQIDAMRSTVMQFTGSIRDAAVLQAARAKDRLALISVLGGILLFITLVTAWGAVSASRDRLVALSAHTDLVDRLRSWFVPRSLPAVSGVRLEVRYLPSPGGVAAGGDWYDVFLRPDGAIGFVMGDVAGHGPSAVARMAELKNTLRGIAAAGARTDPATEVETLDGITASSRLLATACYAVLDPDKGRLRYCRAGHLPALLRKPGGDVAILDEAGGPPLGVEPDFSRSSVGVDLAPGSVLLMFTDGLIEAPGGDVMRAVRQVARVFETAGNDLAQLADLLVAMRPVRTRADDLSLLLAHWTAEGRQA